MMGGMCGRFTLASSREEMAKYFATLPTPLQTWPRYNVAPTQTVPVVRPAASGRELVAMRWGIVPVWSRTGGPPLINARSETAATKPTFKKALQQRRCLIPATGFYEWRKEGRQKQPYLFRLAAGGLFAFAGLWEIGRDKDGEKVEACAILTTETNDLVQPAHDRMPVILDPRHYAEWLDPALTDSSVFAEWLRPYPADAMTAYPVSSAVNNARHDGPDCAQPLATT
jgi:putative SOS response-associated peptidase YedK